ncbi:Pseudomonalisin precursor [Clavibacter michiganensis]|uniref:Pseudomonalisin n=1 Tax=Clavibacter michiganensis TaxID=28447 RepID=A0A251Y8X6_9MICO|nr:S53 family peptidase [Clavibacter michiganensis]OUE20529.1 Pseudomonalisin precursor [Clavibacter michiganensis]
MPSRPSSLPPVEARGPAHRPPTDGRIRALVRRAPRPARGRSVALGTGVVALAAVAALVASALVGTGSASAVADPAAARAAAGLRALDGSAPSWPAAASPARIGDAPADATVAFTVLLDPARPDAAPAVAAWLRDRGLEVGDARPEVGALPVSGTLALASRAFDTGFALFRVDGREVVAPERTLAVPAALDAVRGVAGTVQGDVLMPTDAEADDARAPGDAEATADASPVPAPIPGQASGGSPASSADDGTCAAWWGQRLTDAWPASVDVAHRSNSLCGYGPAQLRRVDDVPAEDRGAGATIAIVAAYDDPDTRADTDTYSRAVGEPAFAAGQYRDHPSASPRTGICGGPTAWTDEQHLDVQAVHAMAPDAAVSYWGADDCTSTSLYTRILDAAEDGPDVISLSFGAMEGLDTADDRELLNRVLVEAAARDVSVFASTGNDGDYSGVGDHGGTATVASPASSPYVTAVGATSTGLAEDGSIAVEAGWETETRFARNGALIPPGFAFGAGGGQSAVYARPTWQADRLAVAGTGRLLPDVASLGDPDTGFITYGPHKGRTEYAAHGGTSLATPMVASMVAISKAVTGRRFGLASPALYALMGTGALRDVQPASAATWSPTGPSAGALWPETLYMWDTGRQGLRSAPGWDDVTGAGVPAGRAFIEGLGAEAGR